MLTEQQGYTLIPQSITVYDALIVSQIIEKALQAGIITGRELGYISAVRNKLHEAVKHTVGVDIDSLPLSEQKPVNRQENTNE